VGVGEKRPFEAVYREFLPRVYGFVVASVRSQAEAEDVTSAVFLKAYEAYARYQPTRGGEAPWLFQIARNVLIDRHRKLANREYAEQQLIATSSPLPAPALLAEANLAAAELWEAVRELPARQREAVALRHSADMAYEQMGAVLGCSADAAKMIYHRAVHTLRSRLSSRESQ
jgi:RNA polymerase sigma-70 factor (ECF subfamily)